MKERIKNYFQGNYQEFYGKCLSDIESISGDEYKACCPFHSDSNPSLNFNDQTGQYYCHGCDVKGDIFSFYGAKNGLDVKSDFDKILKGIVIDFGIRSKKKKSKIVKTYDYVNSNDDLIYQVCRYEPKDFRQRRPVGKDGWIWNLKNVDRVLYRLPEVLESDEIIIVEGEKDADNLNDLGFTATTCSQGAGKWKDSYTKTLKGKNIILMPDNDPEGIKHMEKVAGSLSSQATSIKLIRLPHLKEKEDVSDYIAKCKKKRKAREMLNRRIDKAPLYEPQEIEKEFVDPVIEIADFIALKIPEIRTILRPWVTEQSIILISGWRGVGKSWFCMSLLDAISKGEDFGPWETVHPVKSLYLDAEMPMFNTQQRFKHLNPGIEKIKSLKMYSNDFANRNALLIANLLDEDWRDYMKGFLIDNRIKLWAVDNVASLCPGIDENSKQDWDVINQWLVSLRFDGVSTILVHHLGKSGSQRGTSAREDNIDVSVKLKQPQDYVVEDGCHFIVEFNKSRVSGKDLNLISNTEFKLGQAEDKTLVWSFGDVRQGKKVEILKMLDEGFSYSEIVNILNVTKGYISQVKKQAVKDGLLTSKGELTEDGKAKIY